MRLCARVSMGVGGLLIRIQRGCQSGARARFLTPGMVRIRISSSDWFGGCDNFPSIDGVSKIVGD